MQDLVNSPVTGVFNITWLGGQGMVGAIIIGLLTGWSYSAMLKKGWKITLPEQVPSSVAKQFTAMIPAGVILGTAMLIYAVFKSFMNTDRSIQNPYSTTLVHSSIVLPFSSFKTSQLLVPAK